MTPSLVSNGTLSSTGKHLKPMLLITYVERRGHNSLPVHSFHGGMFMHYQYHCHNKCRWSFILSASKPIMATFSIYSSLLSTCVHHSHCSAYRYLQLTLFSTGSKIGLYVGLNEQSIGSPVPMLMVAIIGRPLPQYCH